MVIDMSADSNGPKPMSPAQATRHIRLRAAQSDMAISFKLHAQQRLEERGLTVLDVIEVLQKGDVLEPAQPGKQLDRFKYVMEGETANSHGRTLKVVVIPGTNAAFKIITVMWKDFD
jgi:hypothetical protein